MVQMTHLLRLSLSAAVVVTLCACSHVRLGMFALKNNPYENKPGAIALGSTVYASQCSRCHGPLGDGNGVEASSFEKKPTNFTSPSYQKSVSLVAAHIMYGKGDNMPAFKNVLSEEEVWEVAMYVASLSGPAK